MCEELNHIKKIQRDKFWLDENGQLREKNPLIDDLMNSIEHLSEGLYSKDTHFIFELIQNAEDNTYNDTEPSLSFQLVKDDPTGTPNATGALVIQNNEVGFKHDNVEAICAIGKSTKSKIQGYIGEKGIGFKSVFRITTIPHIFSNGYQFCLPERNEETGLGYIVPYWVEKVQSGIDPKQTTIILPLDKRGFDYKKIEEMLKDIEPETALFLSKLKQIQIRIDSGDDFTILKDDEKTPQLQLLIEGIKQGEEYSDVRKFFMFTQTVDRPGNITHEKRTGVDRRDVTIAFPADDNKDSMGKIFAYLPVRADTGFPFLINADFILPSSREDILDVPWNRWLMKCLANLLADKLFLLREKSLLTVELLEAFAKRMNELDKKSIFYPIVEAVRNALIEQELLPANDGSFVTAKNAKLARIAELRMLLTHDQLRGLFQTNDDIKWLSGEITEKKTGYLYKYLKKELKIEEIRPKSEWGAVGFAEMISQSFLENQSDEWIVAFYQFLNGQESLWRKGSGSCYNPDGPLRNKPFIRLQRGTYVSPFKEDGSPNAYLPPENDTEFPVVSRKISKDEKALEFLKKLGLIKPDAVAEVIEYVLPKYRQSNLDISYDDHLQDINKILKSYKTDSQKNKDLLVDRLKDTAFIRAENLVLQQIEYKQPRQLYFRDEGLITYFDGNKDAWFVSSKYDKCYNDFFRDLGVVAVACVKRKKPTRWNGHVVIVDMAGWHKRGLNGFDPEIEVNGLEYALTHPTIEKSLFIWNRVVMPNSECIHGTIESSSRKTYEGSDKKEGFSENFGQFLIDTHWLPDDQGNFHKPDDLSLDELPDSFIRDEKLADLLGMKKDEIKKIEEKTGGKFIPREEYAEYTKWKEQKAKTEKIEGSAETELETDTGEIDCKDELRKSCNRPGETELQYQITDNGIVSNPDRRRAKSYKGHKENIDNEPSYDERRKETRRNILEGPDERVREYLMQMYRGKCQICGKTFPERDGKPFFIANYIVPRKLARFTDTPANALCLCAEHFAKWQHGTVEAENIPEQIEDFKVELEGGNIESILWIKLCGEECKIEFKEKHLLDLQELIRASENQT